MLNPEIRHRIIQLLGEYRGHPHPGQKYKHGWIPVGPIDLLNLSDDELLDHFHQISQQNKPDAASLHAIYAELGRREGQVPDAPADRKIDALMAKGRDYLSAYAEAHNLDEDLLRREQLAGMVDAQRRPGENRERATRRMYDEVTTLNYLQAEDWTRGHMLNATGISAGVSARSLFGGQRTRARKYASEELARFWSEVTPRQTYAEFRATMLGRPSDIKATAAASKLGGNGKDFGL